MGAQDYAEKREARMAEVAEKARLRTAASAASLKKAEVDAKKMEEDAIAKRLLERKEEQKEHDVWVKGQNEFWDEWTKRQKRTEEREKRRLERLEALKSPTMNTNRWDDETSSTTADTTTSSRGQEQVAPASTKLRRGRRKKRLTMQDALRTFQAAGEEQKRKVEL